MVFFPAYQFLFWFLHQNFYLPDWFHYLLCYDQYIVACCRFYFSFNTFVVAIMRYTFIVHQQRVMTFGKKRAKTLFYYMSIIIPIIFGVLHACTLPTPINTQNIAKEVCNRFYQEAFNITCGDPNGVKDECSPILTFVQRYISLEVTYYVGIAVKVVAIIIFLNFLEGFIYWKTFSNIKK